MKAKLLVVHGRSEGKSLLFPAGEYVFGRGTECHIQPNSDWVSRQHCLLRVTLEALFIRDLGSRNGTLVNGARLVGERQLSPGDHLQVGPLVFEVQVENGPMPATSERPITSPADPARETAELPGAGVQSSPQRETLPDFAI